MTIIVNIYYAYYIILYISENSVPDTLVLFLLLGTINQVYYYIIIIIVETSVTTVSVCDIIYTYT